MKKLDKIVSFISLRLPKNSVAKKVFLLGVLLWVFPLQLHPFSAVHFSCGPLFGITFSLISIPADLGSLLMIVALVTDEKLGER